MRHGSKEDGRSLRVHGKEAVVSTETPKEGAAPPVTRASIGSSILVGRGVNGRHRRLVAQASPAACDVSVGGRGVSNLATASETVGRFPEKDWPYPSRRAGPGS